MGARRCRSHRGQPIDNRVFPEEHVEQAYIDLFAAERVDELSGVVSDSDDVVAARGEQVRERLGEDDVMVTDQQAHRSPGMNHTWRRTRVRPSRRGRGG